MRRIKNMKPKTLLHLNEYCLWQIFLQIKRNCERNQDPTSGFNIVKYLDLINFISCSDVFKMYIWQWDRDLLQKLGIVFEILGDGRIMTIDLEQVYELWQSESPGQKEIFWQLCVSAIRENKELETIRVVYQPTRYYGEHLECFEALMNAIGQKKGLRRLDIVLNGYCFQNLPRAKELEIVTVNAGMDAADLVELCRCNQSLRFLSFTGPALYGRFSDIVPYCNQLRNVDLTMKTDADASEYATLAKLPQLMSLILRGYHRRGTLAKLFQDLAGKCLVQLVVRDTLIHEEETQPMARIHSLRTTQSGFYDAQAIAPLARQRNLQYVAIYVQPDQYLETDRLVDLLRNGTKVRFIKEHWRLLVKYEERWGKLELSLERYWALKESYWKLIYHITPIIRLLNVVYLTISGEFTADMLHILCHSLAKKKLQVLKTLEIKMCSKFSEKHGISVASIPSLATFVCDTEALGGKINFMRKQRPFSL
ncbi:uncharacterized protein LOC122818624 [Drosophila biarmipes]|uniref:uncharacterized protein LOC122818624 n=1 Tax=Drosophila biarmipes TaxID=125945 RepID=UPI001CDA64ED|nr:uncharacterized protein LOC122818624 [Drosophila biarmipes]